jgi:pimeloyl-ACP methyl ester carboxylesterase
VPIGFRISKLPLLKYLLGNIMPRSVVRSSIKNVYGNPEKGTENLVNRYFELNIREGIQEALGKRFIDTKVDRIGELTQPTFIMWGEQDSSIPISVGQRFYRAIDHSEFISLEVKYLFPPKRILTSQLMLQSGFCIATKRHSFRQ